MVSDEKLGPVDAGRLRGDAQVEPKWGVDDWLRSLALHEPVAAALRPPAGVDEFEYVRSLSREALDAKLAVERDRVAKLKKRREKKRMREASRSESKGFAANDMLVLDYEKRKVEITQTEARIQELKERYALLEADVAKNNALIAARTVGE